MDILISSNNKGKIKEFKMLLDDYFDNFYSLSEKGIALDVVEDGDTFEANAIKKAREAYRASGMPSLADDSGLMVDALNGAPGIYSARFAGENADDKANNSLLLEKMKDVPEEKRTARFVSTIALCIDEETCIVGTGSVEGIILTEPKGEGGFGYDCLFYHQGYGMTFAQISAEEKNTVSHRIRAVENLAEKLKERNIG